jgi:transcriptional regulator with XRE-family HTH domain
VRRYHLRVRESVKDATPAVAQQLPPDPLASAVARSVSDLRHSAGLSERAAARKLGTSQTQLRRMEDPRYLPSLRSLARLAMVYGYELKVDFALKGAVPVERGSRGAGTQKAAAARTKAAPAKPKTAPRKRASASASPSKGRAGAPRRGRAAARGRARRAAPRRRS